MALSEHQGSHRPDRIDRAAQAIRKILDALNRKEYAEAFIRASQAGIHRLLQDILVITDYLHKGFDPTQPRDSKGKWTETGDEQATTHAQTEAVVDPFCRIMKKLCIAEATETLPTRDNGMMFFTALNACMDRYGCLGRA